MTAMSRTFSLALVPGDGIGPEVTSQALKVLDLVAGAHDISFTSTDYDLGALLWHAPGATLPGSVLEEVRPRAPHPPRPLAAAPVPPGSAGLACT